MDSGRAEAVNGDGEAPVLPPGYVAEQRLRASAWTEVWAVRSEADDRRAIAKIATVDGAAAVRLEHELRRLAEAAIPGVIAAQQVIRAGGRVVSLYERVDAVGLASFAAGRPLRLDTFMRLALGLAAAVAGIHEQGLLLRALRPKTIAVVPETVSVRLRDVGVAALLEWDPAADDLASLRRQLPYTAPEHCGQIRSPIDARSELYSLGCVFYELLVGRPPFVGEAAVDLVHAHLTRRPPALARERSDIPRALAELVMRLLEKPPERRYQSARSLLADLQTIAGLEGRGGEAANFELGALDAAALRLPQCFGHELALARLEAELAAALEAGETRLVVLEGEAGVGKTALLQAFEGPLMQRWGLLGVGRFVEPDKARPYHGLVEAASGLVAQILQESELRSRDWAERLRGNLGSLAGVIVELVPTLARSIGAVAPVPEVEPDEGENRLRTAMTRFFAAFGERGPLVLVFDDLQWATRNSLELLQELLRTGIGAPLLIIAAARREGEATAVLRALVDEHPRACSVTLAALARPAVAELLAAALGEPVAAVAELATLVHARTDGNPLFVRLVLQDFVARGLLRREGDRWRWDPAAITAAELPGSAVAVATEALDRLREPAATILALAACLGLEFALSDLDRVAGDPIGDAAIEPPQVFAAVDTLERAGLIAATARGYRFVHPRLRAMAEARAGAARRRQVGWALGCRALAEVRGQGPVEAIAIAELGDRLYEIVAHLHAGIADFAELDARVGGPSRHELAWLDLAAGRRALSVAAWERARTYLDRACALLGTSRDGLAFAAGLARAEALALTGAREQSEAQFEALQGWTLSPSDDARVSARRIRMATLGGQVDAALAVGLRALARSGFTLSHPCPRWRTGLWVLRGWRACRDVDLAQLQAMPEIRDERAIAAITVVAALKNAAYLCDLELFAALCGLHVWLLIAHGFHPSAPVALAQLSIAVAAALDRPIAAGALCDRALALCDRDANAVTRPRAESAAVLLVWPCCRPWRISASRVIDLQRAAVEAGDLELAGYCSVIGLAVLNAAGTELGEIVVLGRRWLADLERWGTRETRTALASNLALAEVLSDEAGDHGRGQALLANALEGIDRLRPISVHVHVINRCIALCLLGRGHQAYPLMQEILESCAQVLQGSWQIPRFLPIVAVLIGERLEAGGLEADARLRLRRRLRVLARESRRWAAGSAENFGAAVALIDAERHRARGRHERALADYERARELAETHELPLLEIVAGERLAALALALGRRATAHGGVATAIAAARRWGASRVEQRLLRSHEALLLDDGARLTTSAGTSAILTAATRADVDVDFDSILATTQMIAEKLSLDEVVARVLDAAVEWSRADQALLLINRAGRARVFTRPRRGEAGAPDEDLDLDEPGTRAPVSVLSYVLRTGSALIVGDVRVDPRFAADPYFAAFSVCSLLALPIVTDGAVAGALVLEDHQRAQGFAEIDLVMLRVLVAQAQQAIDNARLYEALGRSEAHWRSLVDGAPAIISVMDRQGRLEFVNHLEPFDVPPAALIGVDSAAVMASAEGPSWTEVLQEVIATGERRELEVFVAPATGGRRDYHVRVAPITVDGEIGKLISIATDITARKEFETDRAALEFQLRQQQRLESIGTLASGVAHEINNPIQGIMNYAELLGAHPGDAETVSEFAAEIALESNRVATIVSNLMAFSRQDQDPQALEAGAVSSLIEDTLSLFRAILRKHQIELTVEVPPGLPRVRCRRPQIQQVIMNLVTNARDALEEVDDARRRIEIRAAGLVRDGRSWLRLSIADQGPGIPVEAQPQIFDPFFTTKGRDRGTGLGLAVAHAIAVEHGGELSFETAVGEGTVFHLDLPADGDGDDGV